MPELELALTDLGRHIEFPPTPDVTPRVRERLAERPESRRGLTRRRGLALAFALLAVAVAAVLAVPGVVDTGLFLGTAERVLVGHPDGWVEVLRRS